MADIKEDYLGFGDYKVYQDREAYCFTSDSIRLSHFAKCKNSDKVLELCAGCGIVALHKFAENEDAGDKGRGQFHLVELQKVLYDLLVKNIEVNKLNDIFYPINDDLNNTFKYVNKAEFDVVLCNPPYEKDSAGFLKKSESDKIARAEITTTFEDIASVATNALRYGGAFYFICKSERMFEISRTLDKRNMRIKNVQFVNGGGRFRLTLVKAVKGANDGVEFGVYKD